MKALIFNIKRYAIHDGPGIRITFFMKSCPLNCWWCHNPEGISAEIQEVDRIDRIGGREFVVKEKVGKYYSADQILEIVRKDMVFIEESGGGVTFSGGEPLMQADFLYRVLKLLKEEGIHTAVDTSGHAPGKAVDRLLPYTDLFLFDIKHLEPAQHRKYTGVSNDMILKNYNYILQKGAEVIIRIPVIPGFNDDAGHLHALRDFVSSRAGTNVSRIDLLPYHRIGRAKYKKFDIEYKMPDIEQPSAERMNELKEFFAESGIITKIGG